MEQLTKIDYSLRFINTDEKSLFLIKSMLKGEPKSIRQYYKNPANYVVTYTVLESFEIDVLTNIFKKIDAEKTDIFISVRPNSDSDIIDIPLYVTRLLVVPQLSLTLSYTIT